MRDLWRDFRDGDDRVSLPLFVLAAVANAVAMLAFAVALITDVF